MALVARSAAADPAGQKRGMRNAEQTNGSGDCRMVAATVQPKPERWLLIEHWPVAAGSTPPENAVAIVLLGKNVRIASSRSETWDADRGKRSRHSTAGKNVRSVSSRSETRNADCGMRTNEW
jgi:hypothetical protein